MREEKGNWEQRARDPDGRPKDTGEAEKETKPAEDRGQASRQRVVVLKHFPEMLYSPL